ncbi:hypothetical protein XELAEV_18026587mg [Xenopus laevis]|uniref:Ninein-like protein n=1 Tax=Xenopus laevis TaxID=8355 RepID=A0A974CVV5_XENLA|nr:hypothetical protein XELAEV_18026587mg [Xenopus laevis]
MDKEEENKYVSQLLGVFNSCDTTGTGYLDKEELTDLCHKLHLDAQLPLLLQTLLGTDIFARVNFEEFKEGFVAVLSSTIDISISEDESSYLEPVIPDEVKPKYVKGTKRYGRRTQPEREAAENEANKCLQEQHQVKGQRKSQLKRSSSLESVESLKSDEEAENGKEPLNENFEAQGQLRAWNPEIFDGRRRNSSPCSDMTEHQVRDIWEELGVGHNGYLNQQELATVCKNIGLKDLSKEELEDLFNKLDRDGDGRVSFQEFQDGLFSHAPVPISSTPLKNRRPWACFQPVEDSSRMTTTNSLLSAFGGLHLFSTIDDGTGFGSPEQIMIIWEEEGIEDGKEILTSLDFSLGERVNLLDLTTALDNELIATKNRIHMAALASYKNELYHQHGLVEQVTRERDKVKQDFEKAEKRNLQLANEVDDHNSEMEQLNESKIKDLELEYRQRLSVLRTELESEKEQFIHQADQHKTKLESDLANLKIEEAALRERLNLSVKENSRLQKEMVEVVEKLSEAENDVVTLQTNVEDMLKGKRQSDHPHMEFCNQDERFADIINEYEIQCRELRDQNDELQIQLETLRSQLSESKYSRLLARIKDNKLLHLKAKEKIHNNSLSNGSQGKKGMSTKLRRSASAAGANGPVAMEPEPPPVNIEAELTKQQLKEQQQEIQDLKIELETKVNYYEREVELMKSNFEKERKATEHSFKLEISELEEQKADLEELNAKYQEVIDGLKVQLSKSAQCQEMEKRFKEEKFELEQYYAKEISALGQRLTAEKDQLEEELRRTHQHELQSMRQEAEEELNEKLAASEAQWAEHWQNLLQQHYNEKNEALEKYELAKISWREEQLRERNLWEERERTLLAQCRKEQLKQEEKHSEEQAHICKTFAIEKEEIESQYKIQMNRLNREIKSLSSCLESRGNDSTMTADRGPSGQYLNLNSDDKDHSNKTEVVHFIKQDELSETTGQLTETPNPQCAQILYCLKDVDEKLSLLKRTEESAEVKLHKMECVVSSLRAQLLDDIKETEALLKKHGYLEEEKAQLSRQLEAMEEERLLSEAKQNQLMVELWEKCDYIKVQDSKLQLISKDNEELEKQVAALTGQAVALEHKLNAFSGKYQEMTARLSEAIDGVSSEQNVCHTQDGDPTNEGILMEELLARNTLLSRQLSNKEEEVYVLQREMNEMVRQFQELEIEAIKYPTDANQENKEERDSVIDKLVELEDLVRQLERETETSQDDRMELCRLTEDNGLLRNKLEGLQKEVHDFEDQANKHRKEVEHLKKEKEKLVCELEELNKQSQKYQEEARLLNAQSLQLSNAILDLTAQNKQNQETMQQLSSSLRDMAQQKEEAAASVTQLQEMMCRLEQANVQQEAESQGQRDQLEKDLQRFKDENQKYQDELHRLNAQTLQLNASVADLSAWKMEKQETLQNLTSQLRDVTQREEAEQAEGTRLHKVLSALEREKDRLEHELDVSKEECQKYREELRQLNTQSLQLSSSVSDLSVQHSGNQEVIQQLNNRLREVTKQKEDAAAVVEQLKDVLNTLEREKLQHLAAWQQERNQLAQELRTSNEKMENHTQKHMREKEGLLSGLHESNKQLVIMDSLQEEVTSLRQEKQSLGEQCHSLTSQLKDVAAQVMKMHKLERDLKVAHEESQTLKRNQAQLRETLAECQDQLLEANSKLTLEQSQHMRQVQQLKEQVSCAVPMEQVTELQNRLREEEQNSLQLQDKMRFHAEQTNRLLAMQQEEHEKLLRRMEERLEEVEMDLKNVRLMLQEKVNQLKEQLEKNAKSGLLLKDLYVENAQLMKALQVTEQRQKSAEKKNYLLEEKISALNKVIGRIAPASLAV